MKGQGFRSSPGGRGGTPRHPCSTGLRRRLCTPAYGSSKGGVRPDRPPRTGPPRGLAVRSGSGRKPPAESSGRSSTPLRPVPPPDRPAMRPPPSLDPYHIEARQQDRKDLRASAVAQEQGIARGARPLHRTLVAARGAGPHRPAHADVRPRAGDGREREGVGKAYWNIGEVLGTCRMDG